MSLFQKPIEWDKKFQKKAEFTKDEILKSFYKIDLPNTKVPIKDIEFVALDLETSGFNFQKNDIISIGLVPFNMNRILLSEAKEWVLCPKKNIDDKSIIIHGITHNDFIGAPSLDDILEELLASLAGKVVVAHYHQIERNFLKNALLKSTKEELEFPIVDTFRVEEFVQRKSFVNIIRSMLGNKKSLRLSETRRRYGLPDYMAHHALTDAIATAELLQAQIKHHYSSNISIGNLWI